MSQPIDIWPDLRGNCDDALKLLAQMPAAINIIDEDTVLAREWLEQIMAGLSDALHCLHLNIGERTPETPVDLSRITRAGGRVSPDDDELDPTDPQRMTIANWPQDGATSRKTARSSKEEPDA